MTVKSILEIDVRDEKFKEFLQSFERYQDAVAKMPGEWGKIGQATGAQRGIMDALIGGLGATLETTHGVTVEQAKGNLQAQKMMALWEQIAKNTEATANNIANVSGRARDTENSSRKTVSFWNDLKRSTKEVGQNFEHAFRVASGFRRAAKGAAKGFAADFLGPIALLLGTAGSGLFGLDRLAAAASASRRSAMGLGIGYGEQQAFGVNFRRFVDPEAMLGNVATGLYDIQSPQYRALIASGISSRTLAGGDAADVSVELLRKLPQIFAGISPNAPGSRELIGSRARALGIDQVISIQDIVRYLKASPQEREQQEEQYEADKKKYKLTDQQLRGWVDFKNKMDEAGKLIEKTFILGLSPLLPSLGRLSTAFSNAVASFMKSDTVQHGIDKVAHGLQWLADHVDTPQFQKDVDDFIHNVGKMASKIVDILKALGIVPRGSDDKGPAPDDDSVAAGLWRIGRHLRGEVGDRDAAGEFASKGIPYGWNGPASPFDLYGPGRSIASLMQNPARQKDLGKKFGLDSGSTPEPAPSSDGGFTGKPDKSVFSVPRTAPGRNPFALIESHYGLPPGLLWSVEGAESAHGRNMGPSGSGANGGAKGWFQFEDATAREYGLDNPYDRGKSANAAGRYFEKLLREFHGDVPKAVAGYNWGEGRVERDVARWGSTWAQHLPREVRNYLDKVLPGVGAAQPDIQACREALPENSTAGVEREIARWAKAWREHDNHDRPVQTKPAQVTQASARSRQTRSPGRAVIEIQNNTGGAAVILTRQLAV